MRKVTVEQMPGSYYFRCTLLEVSEDINKPEKEIYHGFFQENFVGQAVTHMLSPSVMCPCIICMKIFEHNTKLAEQNK